MNTNYLNESLNEPNNITQNMIQFSADIWAIIIPSTNIKDICNLCIANKIINTNIQNYYCRLLEKTWKLHSNLHPVSSLNKNNNSLLSIYLNIVRDWRQANSWLLSVDNLDFNNYGEINIVNPGMEDNYAIRCAAKYGYTENVKKLLIDRRVTNKCCFDRVLSNILQTSCTNNYLEIAQLLFDKFSFNNTSCSVIGAFETAKKKKYYDIVELFLTNTSIGKIKTNAHYYGTRSSCCSSSSDCD